MMEVSVVYLIAGTGVSAEDRHFLPSTVREVCVLEGTGHMDVERVLVALRLQHLPRIQRNIGNFATLPHLSVAVGTNSHAIILGEVALCATAVRSRVLYTSENVYVLQSLDPESRRLGKEAMLAGDFMSGICSVRIVDGQVAGIWPLTSCFPTAA